MAVYCNVLNQTMSGTVVIEGRARILKTIDGDTKLVDFEDGYGPVVRYIDPKAQGDDVACYVADLNAGISE